VRAEGCNRCIQQLARSSELYIDIALFSVRYDYSQIMASFSCIGLLFLFMYSIATVFVIVGGQSTTDDDSGNSIMDQLINAVANLQTQVTKLVAENKMLKANVTKLAAQESIKSKSLCILFDAVCTAKFLLTTLCVSAVFAVGRCLSVCPSVCTSV